MFGSQARQVADVAELTDVTGSPTTPSGTVSRVGEAALELERVTVEPGPGEIGAYDVSLQVWRARSWVSRASTGTASESSPRRSPGSVPSPGATSACSATPWGGSRSLRREKLGLRYVTDDRLHEGTVRSLSVAMNIVLKQIGKAPFWERGRIRYAAILDRARELISRFEIRARAQTRVGALSGGNVQKVVLARELSFDPKVVVYSKPTYGLDVKTTRSVGRRFASRREGVTSIVISTDLEELLDLCDRIAVLSRGRVAGVVENGPNAQQQVGELMVGRAA